MTFIRSPLNYTGGKYRLLPQILPLFPKDIETFADLFAGGFNVGINVPAKRHILNDNLIYLVDLYRSFYDMPLRDIITHIEGRVAEYGLTKENQKGYLALRSEYNRSKYPPDLFVLTAFSFNHHIRFNNSHEYNESFGRNRSSWNNAMKANLIDFVAAMKNMDIAMSSADFGSIGLPQLEPRDLVYCDPPYLISCATYNDGKRGFTGWNEKEEARLLSFLDNLDAKGVRFALSNIIAHKGKRNEILSGWIGENGYRVHELSASYSNSSYNVKDRSGDATREVLVVNYE